MKHRIPSDLKIPQLAAEYTHHVYLVLSHLGTPTLILAQYGEDDKPFFPSWAHEYIPLAEPAEVTFTSLEVGPLLLATRKALLDKRASITHQYYASCESLDKAAKAAGLPLPEEIDEGKPQTS